MRRIETHGIIDYVEVVAEREVRLLGGKLRKNAVSSRCEIIEHRTTTEVRHAVRICVIALRKNVAQRGGRVRNVTVIYPPGIGQ